LTRVLDYTILASSIAIVSLEMPPTPEPFSRILIDKALEASGWNLLDPRRVRLDEGFQALYLWSGVYGGVVDLTSNPSPRSGEGRKSRKIA